MRLRTTIVLLVVLAVLFAAAVAVGASRASQPALGETPGWLEGLGKALVPKQALQPEEISAAIPPGCEQGLAEKAFVLPQGATCTMFVAESKSPVRTLPLRLASGTAAVVFDPFGEAHMRVESDLGGDRQSESVQVFEEGGELRISCLVGACRIEVR